MKEEPKTHDAGQNFHPREEKNYSGSLSTTKKVGIAATGLFVMSCALLCPCFYKKRKATAHTVLARDPNSSKPSYRNLIQCHDDKMQTIYSSRYASQFYAAIQLNDFF